MTYENWKRNKAQLRRDKDSSDRFLDMGPCCIKREDGDYLKNADEDDGEWTPNAFFALQFETVGAALAFVRKNRNRDSVLGPATWTIIHGELMVENCQKAVEA